MQMLTQKLEEVELKIRKLGQKMELLRKENATLSEENINIKKNLEKQQLKLFDIEKNAASAGALLEQEKGDGAADSNQIKAQLAHYIKEIDKCLEWLQHM
ncbi:MAG: hypothetical protein ABIV51_09005 [Saprospiraceae bacterium]